MTVRTHEEKSQPGIRILLIDDYPIMRFGLMQLINQESDLVVCGEVGDDQQALRAAVHLQPSLILVGLALHGHQGLGLLKQMQEHAPSIPILVLSNSDETLFAIRALQTGVRGYIPKRTTTDAILSAIRRILRGEIAVSDHLASQLVQTAVTGKPVYADTPVSRLSNRELEVLHYIGEGYATREIAEKLCISIKTVETYRSHLIKKLNLNHSRELIRYAIHWISDLETS
jgi:DNA-binding NarL/FixJ family response regulator